MAKSLPLTAELVLILLLLALTLVLAALGVTVGSNPLGIIRLLLGLLVVLLLPGYGLIGALFPRAESLDRVVRLALSVSASLAIIPLLALLLDRLPWGIHFWPVVVSEALLIVLFSLVSWHRRTRLLEEERFQLSLQFGIRTWWQTQDRLNRIIYLVLSAIILVAISSAIAILLNPQPGNYFTEFYILEPEDLAEYYPREVVVGEPVSVTVGLTNLERGDHYYHIEVWAVDSRDPDHRQLMKKVAPFQLSQGQNFEYPLNWAMPWPGEDQQVEFLLIIDQYPQPYRSLRLWLDVLQSDG